MATTPTFTEAGTAKPALPPQTPSMDNGDRLSRAEFERRYDALPNVKRAELLEGVVYMPSPVRMNRHARPHFELITWLGTYQVATPGVAGGDNGSIRLDLDNEPQPDAFLLVEPAKGGQARIDDEDYVVGAPELVAEITSSNVSYDLGVKLNVYRRNAVREYVVWRVLDREVDWFVLRAETYERLSLQDGVYRSECFPGLWLDPAALVSGDLARVHAVLQEGLKSAEHQLFVVRLGQATT
jgi:Uma2 family endonuclease